LRYKIGDVARILGISPDLIRYYEEKGIVAPEKDSFNNYRYYDAWDINFLIDCLWYKKLGFSIEEIARMTTSESYDDLVYHMREQAERLEEQLKYQTELAERMRVMTEKVAEIRGSLGVCEFRSNAAFIYYLNRRGGVYDNGPEYQRLNKEWERLMPFTRRLFVIEESALGGARDETRWGYSMRADYAEKYHVDARPPVVRMPSVRCVRAAFKSHGKGGFTARHLDFMLDWARELGLAPAGAAFGNLICSIPEDGQITGYFEAWLPVGKA